MPQKRARSPSQSVANDASFSHVWVDGSISLNVFTPEELDCRPTSMGKAIPDTEILVINEPGNPGALRAGRVSPSWTYRIYGYWGQPELTTACCAPIHSFLQN